MVAFPTNPSHLDLARPGTRPLPVAARGCLQVERTDQLHRSQATAFVFAVVVAVIEEHAAVVVAEEGTAFDPDDAPAGRLARTVEGSVADGRALQGDRQL